MLKLNKWRTFIDIYFIFFCVWIKSCSIKTHVSTQLFYVPFRHIKNNMASSFCSLFIFVCLVCCVIVASRPHFESKNHGDAFRHRSVEPRLRLPNHSNQSLRVLPQEISGSVQRESGTQLLVDSVPASDLTLTAFIKHVRGQMPPMDATTSVFAKNAHLHAVQVTIKYIVNQTFLFLSRYSIVILNSSLKLLRC